MGNYTLYFGKENIHVGCDLVIFLIREGFVGGFGGREKFFVSERQRENIKCIWDTFGLLGPFFHTNERGVVG